MLGNFDSLGIIDQTYSRVEDVFYRPVDLQTLLNGSRDGTQRVSQSAQRTVRPRR